MVRERGWRLLLRVPDALARLGLVDMYSRAAINAIRFRSGRWRAGARRSAARRE